MSNEDRIAEMREIAAQLRTAQATYEATSNALVDHLARKMAAAFVGEMKAMNGWDSAWRAAARVAVEHMALAVNATLDSAAKKAQP